MGFYPPASLVRDGERRGVRVLAPDVNASEAQCSIEDGAVRVGVGYVSGVGEKEADAVAAGQPYADLRDLAQRAPADRSWPDRAGLEALVESGACDCFGEPRRAMLWELGLVPRPQSVLGTRGEAKQLALPLEPTTEVPELPEHTRWERMLADYRTTNLSVGPHPLELLRPLLPGEVITTAELAGKRDGERDRDRGPGGRAAASLDRERGRLHAARGRGRARQPRRPAARSTSAFDRSSAASRCSSHGAGSSGSAAT